MLSINQASRSAYEIPKQVRDDGEIFDSAPIHRHFTAIYRRFGRIPQKPLVVGAFCVQLWYIKSITQWKSY